MSRPVRHQDLKVIDAVIAYVRECQAGMLGLSATPLDISPGGKPQVGNSQAEYVAQFCLCGRRVFSGKRLEVFRSFYAQLRDLDEQKAERIVRDELGMEWEELDSHRQRIECSREFADELRAHQMYRRWMQEEESESQRTYGSGKSIDTRKVLTPYEVEEIRKQLRQRARGSQLAKLYGVSESSISLIKSGKRRQAHE